MQKTYTMFLFLFLFLVLPFVLHSQQNASITLKEGLKNDEVFVFRYSLSEKFQRQENELRITFSSRDKRGSSYLVRLQAGTHELYWHASQFDAAIEVVFLGLQKASKETGETLGLRDLKIETRIEKTEGDVPTASLDDMFQWKGTLHPYGFSLFWWQQHPEVLVFFFQDREQQARYLKRASFFIEKRLTRGALRYDHEIQHRKGWGAHDYDAEDLREMFEVGRTGDFSSRDPETNVFPFLPEELRLKRILIEQGLFLLSEADRQLFVEKADDPVFLARVPIQEARGSMVSIAKTYTPHLLRILIFHELLHTFYFKDKELRAFVSQQWNLLSNREKQLWIRFLARNGYDETYEYLVQNEFFAYLLQRPVAVLSQYIRSRILPESKVELSEDEIVVFTEHMKRRSLMLSAYMKQRYGVSDGELRYVRHVGSP